MNAFTFLAPLSSRFPARKTHRLIKSAAGPRLDTMGYGKAKQFTHRIYSATDIEDVYRALETEAHRNAFAIRGQVLPDIAPGTVINRRYKGAEASIADRPSRLLPFDFDTEPAPHDLDLDDIGAVDAHFQTRLPPELQGRSRVLQLSASFKLHKWTKKTALLKCRYWFMNQNPLDAAEFRRWVMTCNDSGRFAQMDPAITAPNQPIYTAAPLFEGMRDPVAQRLALFLDEADECAIVAPIPQARPTYSNAGVGERCPEVLRKCVHIIATSRDGEKHSALNRAAYLAGGFVAGGACTLVEAREALRAAIASKAGVEDIEAAYATIDAALEDGMTAPLGVFQESTDAIPLEESSDYYADLKRLSKAPTRQARATAKKIINRYLWRCPWKISWAQLASDLVEHLPPNSPADLSTWITGRIQWLASRTRETAQAATALHLAKLQAIGIDVVEVDSIDEARAKTEARPECLTLVKAELGTGKTERILKPLALASECSIGITHRVALVDDLALRLELENYKHLKASQLEGCSHLGLCLNSIINPKFGEVLFRAKTVLVDEVSAVVRECHNTNGTLKKRAAHTWTRLVTLLKKATVACGVDADLSTADVLALKEATGRPIQVIVVRSAPTHLSVGVGHADVVWQSILDAAECGEPFRVLSDSANQVRKIEAALRERCPHLRVMAIHAKPGVATNGREDVKEALSDINSAVRELDVLIHSPCVESGVSLTVSRFVRTFGLYAGATAPAAFVQMMRRDRTATRFEIGVLGNGIRFNETSAASILASLEETHRRTVEIGRTEGGYLMKLKPASAWDGRVAEYQAAANVATNHYAQNLWILLESRGYDVQPLSGERVDKSTLSIAATLAAHDYRQAILQAPTITSAEREALETVYQPSPEQSAAMARYDCKETLALDDVDTEALNLWDEGALLKKLLRFEALTAAPLAGLATDAVEDAASISLAARSGRLAKTEAYRHWFEVMGFDLATGTGTVTADSAAESFENLRSSPLRPVIEASGLCRLEQAPKYSIRWLGEALEKFGLALTSERPKAEDGTRERVYRLALKPIWDTGKRHMKAPGWEAMTVIARRRVQIGLLNTITPASGHKAKPTAEAWL